MLSSKWLGILAIVTGAAMGYQGQHLASLAFAGEEETLDACEECECMDQYNIWANGATEGEGIGGTKYTGDTCKEDVEVDSAAEVNCDDNTANFVVPVCGTNGTTVTYASCSVDSTCSPSNGQHTATNDTNHGTPASHNGTHCVEGEPS